MAGGGDMGDGRLAPGLQRDSRTAAASQKPQGEPYSPAHLYSVPTFWQVIAVAMAVAMLPPLATASTLPGFAVAGPAAVAMLLGAMAPIFFRLERDLARNARQRGLIMVLAIGLPMVLYGVAAAAWAREQGQPLWIGAVGMTALASATASILLARRPPALLVAAVSSWLPLVVAAGSREASLIFATGAVGGAFLVARQNRIIRTAMAQRRQHERIQARAFSILVDYEKSGQGWFWETDREGAITYLSPRLGAIFGEPVEDLHGRSFLDLFVHEAATHDAAELALSAHFSSRATFQDIVVRPAGEGEERWWSISGSPIHDRHGTFFGFRGFGTDQTEKRRSLERTSRLAHTDSLTGLANRLQMSQALERILHAQHEEHRSCAIFLVDLDRFKQVNDTLGHPAGDAVLKQVAERLRRAVDGAGRIGRLGGDEFQVILPGPQHRDDLAKLASAIVASLSAPYALDAQRAVIGASLGIALAPDDGVTSEALIRNADLALYAAKDAGRGRFRFYAPDLHSDAEERRELERDLRDAVVSGGLELWYQPVVHTLSETITGFEALLRWNHPRLGRLSPGKFVPLAEEAGLIAQIGEWALRTACRDLASWPEPVRVAVNLSPLQFANPALPAIVASALAAAEVSPSRLELEITESVFLNDYGSVEAMFAALKGLGVRIALDDFGTGYSSLGYLEAAPFDRLKIDQTFLRGAVATGSRNGPILASIVGLAEELGMETTAEGVETLDELELARTLGCSHVQGYIYEAAMSLGDTVKRLAEGLTARPAGPRMTRDPRQSVLRRVVLEIGGARHDAMIRNVSISGAMIEGPGQVQPGTAVAMHIADGHVVSGTARWCEDGRIGVDFAAPLTIDPQARNPVPLPAIARTADESSEIRRAS